MNEQLEPLGSSPRPPEPTFDFLDLLAVLRRRRLVMTLVFVGVVAAGVAYTVRQPRIYEAKVSIIIKPNAIRPLGRQVDLLDEGTAYNWFRLGEEQRKTQVQVITSRSVLEKVVSKLRLDADPDFSGWGRRGKVPAVEAALAALSARLTVEAPRDSMLVYIAVRDGKAERAARVANAVLDAYTEVRRESKLQTASYAVGWLEEQAANLREKLDAAERRMYQFQKENRIEASSFESYQALLSQRQQQLTQEHINALRQVWEVQAQVESLKQIESSGASLLNSPLVTDNQNIQHLSKVVADLEGQLVRMAPRYGPRHPEYAEAAAALEGARKALAEELALFRSRLEQRRAEVLSTARRAEAALEEAKREALRLNQLSVDYQRLKYEIENLRNLYAVVVKRSKETQVGGMSEFLDMEVVDLAVVPTVPVLPRKQFNILISILAGITLSIVSAFVFERIDTKLSGPEEARRIIGSPYLGTVPQIRPKDIEDAARSLKPEARERFLSLDERRRIEFFPTFFGDSSVAESVRLVRTNILFAAADDTFDTILVTSANPKEGKSTLVNYLGQSLAAMQKRVVVIDSDLHRPMLHRTFLLDNRKGVSSWIAGMGTLDEVIRHTDITNLDVVTSGPIPPNPAEMLGSGRFEEMLRQLRERYDFLVLDSPPLLALSDAMVLSRFVNGIVMVVQPEITDRRALRSAIRHLHDISGHVFGFVVNCVDFSRKSYYGGSYGYEYGYGYGYGRYGRRGGYHSRYRTSADTAEAPESSGTPQAG